MQANQVLELIKGRRSVRRFTDEPVAPEQVRDILEAGRWSPSGLNNQAWRFLVVTEPEVKQKLAPLTRYHAVIKGAPVLIPVFIHKPSMYHEVKDHQAMGACLENMLLMAHGLGLGAVWLGEILKSAEEVRVALGVSPEHELMAVLAIGHPASPPGGGDRKSLDDLML